VTVGGASSSQTPGRWPTGGSDDDCFVERYQYSRILESDYAVYDTKNLARFTIMLPYTDVCRLMEFRRVPPVTGRYINMTSEIRPFASSHLNKTFFTSPGGSTAAPTDRALSLRTLHTTSTLR